MKALTILTCIYAAPLYCMDFGNNKIATIFYSDSNKPLFFEGKKWDRVILIPKLDSNSTQKKIIKLYQADFAQEQEIITIRARDHFNLPTITNRWTWRHKDFFGGTMQTVASLSALYVHLGKPDAKK